MDILEMMKEMTEQLISVEEKINKIDADREALIKERDALKSKIDFGKQVADYYENKIKEEADYRAEAVAQLYVSNRTDADIKTLCEQTTTELPEQFESPTVEKVALEELAASG